MSSSDSNPNDTISMKKSELQHFLQKSKDLKQKLIEVESENKKLKEKLDTEIDSNKKYIQEIEKTNENKLNKLKDANNTLINRLEKSNKQKDELLVDHSKLEIEKQELNTCLIALQYKYDNIKEITDMELIHQIDVLNNKNFNLQLNIDELNKQNNTKEIEILKADNNILSNKNKEYELIITEKDIVINKFNNDIIQLNTNNDILSTKITEIENNNKDLNNKLTKVLTKLSIKKKNISELTINNNNLIKKYSSSIAPLKLEINNKAKECNKLKKENTELKANYNSIIINNNNNISITTSPSNIQHNRMIVESMAFKIKSLEENELKLNKELSKYKLKHENSTYLLEEKVNLINKLIEELQKNNTSDYNNLNYSDIERIFNARNNKSHDDLKDLIQKLIIENINIKNSNNN